MPHTATVPRAGDLEDAKCASGARGGAGVIKRGQRRVTEPRLAIRVAESIEKRIVAEGWPIGQFIGTEATLMAEYSVSRAVLRD